MNLINCDQHCRHQQEGYCTLNHITRLTNDATAKCGYYEASSKAAPPTGSTAGPQLNDPRR